MGVTGWEGAEPRGLGRFQDNQEPSSSKREKSDSSRAAPLWAGREASSSPEAPSLPWRPHRPSQVTTPVC